MSVCTRSCSDVRQDYTFVWDAGAMIVEVAYRRVGRGGAFVCVQAFRRSGVQCGVERAGAVLVRRRLRAARARALPGGPLALRWDLALHGPGSYGLRRPPG